MEYLPGGELYDHVLDREGLAEPAARNMFCQIVNAVQHCHLVSLHAHTCIIPMYYTLWDHSLASVFELKVWVCKQGTIGVGVGAFRVQQQLGTSCMSPKHIVVVIGKAALLVHHLLGYLVTWLLGM